MYALLIPVLAPFVLLGTVMALSWWEDRLLPSATPCDSLRRYGLRAASFYRPDPADGSSAALAAARAACRWTSCGSTPHSPAQTSSAALPAITPRPCRARRSRTLRPAHTEQIPMPIALLSRPFLTEQHRRLQDQVEALTAAQIAPLASEMESRGPHTDPEIRKILSATGLLGVLINTEQGGLGLGHVAKTVIIQVLSRTSPAAGAILQASILGAAPIAEYGSADMQHAWLPEIAAGRCWPTIAVTDPEQGSHILGMEVTARHTRTGYVLDGEKAFTGNAALADVHCVVARTGTPGEKRSLTAFLVEKGTAGLDVVPQRVNGLHGFSVDTLRMSGVHVPKTQIIGEVGDGFDIAQTASVVYGRLNLAAVALGTHERMLEETVRWVSTRKRYGDHLCDLDTARHRVAKMQACLMTAEVTTYHAAHLLDQGEPCDPWLHHAKLTAHNAGVESAEHAKQLYGGHAGVLGTPVEQLRRDIDLINAPAGPEDLQLKRISETALGPSRPQWSTRHAVSGYFLQNSTRLLQPDLGYVISTCPLWRSRRSRRGHRRGGERRSRAVGLWSVLRSVGVGGGVAGEPALDNRAQVRVLRLVVVLEVADLAGEQAGDVVVAGRDGNVVPVDRRELCEGGGAVVDLLYGGIVFAVGDFQAGDEVPRVAVPLRGPPLGVVGCVAVRGPLRLALVAVDHVAEPAGGLLWLEHPDVVLVAAGPLGSALAPVHAVELGCLSLAGHGCPLVATCWPDGHRHAPEGADGSSPDVQVASLSTGTRASLKQ